MLLGQLFFGVYRRDVLQKHSYLSKLYKKIKGREKKKENKQRQM